MKQVFVTHRLFSSLECNNVLGSCRCHEQMVHIQHQLCWESFMKHVYTVGPVEILQLPEIADDITDPVIC